MSSQANNNNANNKNSIQNYSNEELEIRFVSIFTFRSIHFIIICFLFVCLNYSSCLEFIKIEFFSSVFLACAAFRSVYLCGLSINVGIPNIYNTPTTMEYIYKLATTERTQKEKRQAHRVTSMVFIIIIFPPPR